MRYTFDKEHIEQVAKELGMKVRWNLEKPGINNITTGEHLTFNDISWILLASH